ncbi:ATP-binding protein [Streptomyces cinereoruber]|uniref:ATP-binding protein n=1 Tax=Streptomyces cinereoruber TaxID=67260 RepID=UPI0036BA538F
MNAGTSTTAVEDAFEIVIAPEPELVARARQSTVDRLYRWGLRTEAVEVAALVVSELVTNGVVHGKGQVRLRVFRYAEDELRVEVRDESPEPARVRDADDDALGGRGLCLVDALSQGWGVSPDGRTTWAALSAPAGGA